MIEALRVIGVPAGRARSSRPMSPTRPGRWLPIDLAAAWGPGRGRERPWTTRWTTPSMRARSAGGPLVVCGSLYLVGHVRGRLVVTGYRA